MPCTGAAGQLGCSCLPLSCSAAAKVSAGTQLMNRGSPPLPQTEKSHIISEWYFQCKSAITEGGNGTGETQRDFPLQGNRNYKQRGLALSSQPERGLCTPQGRACKGAAVNSPSCQAVPHAALSYHTGVPFQPCPLPASPSTGHRGSPSPTSNTSNSSCATCRGIAATRAPSLDHAPSPQVPVVSSCVLLKSEP